jgi:hypothetical protein
VVSSVQALSTKVLCGACVEGMSAGYGLSTVRSAAFVHGNALLGWGNRLADVRCLNSSHRVSSQFQLTVKKEGVGWILALSLKSIL